jgi:hypothetical protein
LWLIICGFASDVEDGGGEAVHARPEGQTPRFELGGGRDRNGEMLRRTRELLPGRRLRCRRTGAEQSAEQPTEGRAAEAAMRDKRLSTKRSSSLASTEFGSCRGERRAKMTEPTTRPRAGARYLQQCIFLSPWPLARALAKASVITRRTENSSAYTGGAFSGGGWRVGRGGAG